MNVLILTPDAVGSTLLQRMLTIYMQFHQLGRPVINLHELTNGLAKYYSPEFNQELVSKRAVKEWGIISR
jgi:plasmid replication initiation protein